MLRRYRHDVVRPALQAREDAAFELAAAKPVPVLGIPFRLLHGQSAKFHPGTLCWRGSPSFWRAFRCWATVRLTGRWPIGGGRVLPYTVAACPGCGARDITVLHPLCVCVATLPVFQSVCQFLPSQPWDRSSPGWLHALLGTRVEPTCRQRLSWRSPGLCCRPSCNTSARCLSQVRKGSRPRPARRAEPATDSSRGFLHVAVRVGRRVELDRTHGSDLINCFV